MLVPCREPTYHDIQLLTQPDHRSTFRCDLCRVLCSQACRVQVSSHSHSPISFVYRQLACCVYGVGRNATDPPPSPVLTESGAHTWSILSLHDQPACGNTTQTCPVNPHACPDVLPASFSCSPSPPPLSLLPSTIVHLNHKFTNKTD